MAEKSKESPIEFGTVVPAAAAAVGRRLREHALSRGRRPRGGMRIGGGAARRSWKQILASRYRPQRGKGLGDPRTRRNPRAGGGGGWMGRMGRVVRRHRGRGPIGRPNPYAGGGGGWVANVMRNTRGRGPVRPGTFDTPYGTAHGRSGFAMKRGSKPNFKDLGSKKA